MSPTDFDGRGRMRGAATRAPRASRRPDLRRRLFVAYAVLMVGLVAVAPIARACWLWLASAEGLAFAGAAGSPVWLGAVVAGLWCVALLAGRVRGPALLDPWTTHVRAASDLPRWRAFGPAVLRGSAVVVTVVTLAAAVLAAAQLAHGLASPASAIAFVAAGACAGVIAAVCWLVGQATPRLAGLLATLIGLIAALGIGLPAVAAGTPWGLVATGAAPTMHPSGHPALLVLLALSAALLALVPSLLHRLDGVAIVRQARNAAAAGSHAVMFDLEGVRSRYRGVPTGGRRLRAVRPHRSLALTFLRRDAVGAVRMPLRALFGCAGLVIAGLLAILAAHLGASGGAAWPLGAIAGVLALFALGPFADGLRHAADAAQSAPLYGVGDVALLALHAAFPVVVSVVAAAIATGIAAVLGIGVLTALGASCALLCLALMGRAADALKGRMPVGLFVPIPTEAGDLGALRRAVWAIDGLLIAAGAGIAVALVSQAPVLLAIAAAVLVGLLVARRPRRA